MSSENCSIEPEDIRPLMSDGQRIDEYGASQASSDDGKTIGKMIDWCLGLRLQDSDEYILQDAFTTMDPCERTLNQSLEFICRFPLFLDIEIKKAHAACDPVVQLAIWASASLLKRKHHGWDLSIPMPAIAIDGHQWDYIIFFPFKGEKLVSPPLP